MNTTTLSAYGPSLYVVSPNCRPDIKGWALIAAARGSITRANIVGHTCLVPLVMSKGSEVMPEVKTLADG